MEEQQLFLMEFLVDKVNIPAVHAMHDEMLPVVTCVSFQILNLPRIDIFQDAPTAGCACKEGDVQTFKKGKSCLFALPTLVLQKPISTFPVTMSVYKKLPPGVLPDVMLIGTHQIQGKYIMNALLSERAFGGGNPCKTTKDTFKITTATGQCVGEVTLFIRVSCFGKKIVTQFQIPHNRKPYLFKGIEDSPVFQCKRIPSKMQQRPPLTCSCCPLKRVTDGSGEAPRTCCATPPIATNLAKATVPACHRMQGHEKRPCCPSLQTSSGPDDRTRQQPLNRPPGTAAKQQTPYCPPCCAQEQSPNTVPLCQQAALMPGSSTRRPSKPPCCSPPKCPPPPCPPPPKCQSCCPPPPRDLKDFVSLITKEPKLRKCGCIDKEAQGCSCGRK